MGLWLGCAAGLLALLVAATAGARDEAGRVLLYAGTTTSQQSHVFVAQRDGSAAIRLTSSPSDEFQPSWSPDGRYVVFERSRCAGEAVNGACVSPWGAGRTLWIADSDGTQERQLTRHSHAEARREVLDLSPSWSPDGREIAFCRVRAPAVSRSSLWIIRSDGSRLRRVGTTSLPICRGVAWSPDGEQLAVAAWDQVALVTPDGHTRFLTGEFRALVENVTWAPGGSDFAVNDGDLHIFRRDGSPLRVLHIGASFSSRISWSRNGSIYYARLRGLTGHVDIHAVRSTGGAGRLVVRDAIDPAVQN